MRTRAEVSAPWVAVLAGLLLLSGCGTDATESAAEKPPAKVENAAPEKTLATLRLEPRAVERLGIETVAVERRVLPITRTLGGVVIAPPGRTLRIAAPQQGTVLAPHGRSLPLPGAFVKKGETLLRLLAQSPGEIAQARQIVDVATARLAVAEAAAEAAAEAEPGSSAAQAERDAARSALQAARRRLRLLSGKAVAGPGDTLAPAPLAAPIDGMVMTSSVTAGQSVPAGAPLLEIAALDPVWVRTPIYAGDAGRIRAGADATVRAVAAPEGTGRLATPVAGPPSADPLASTVDLYFSVPNQDGSLRPGERVAMTLALGDGAPQLAVPYTAVLYDIHGGTWVYERIGEGVFQRRRIEIASVRDGVAALARGPEAGAEIVTSGSMELFGTEFGTGK